MVDNANPSLNPANTGSMVGMFREVLGKFLQNVDDMLPAKVISFDRATNRAQVQPIIMMVTTEDKTVSRAPVASVPVFQIGGGGFILNFNLLPGDLGWIKANDRDISLYLQAASEAIPNTARKHSFQDAVFFPDPVRGYAINGEDTDNCVLQSLDGSVRVALWSDRVKITAPHIVLDSPLTTITGELQTGTASGGAATFGGSVTATGEITTNLRGGIDLSTHIHNGVQTGGGNTGQPV